MIASNIEHELNKAGAVTVVWSSAGSGLYWVGDVAQVAANAGNRPGQ